MVPAEGRIDQTMLSGVPQGVYEQIAQAAQQSQRPPQPPQPSFQGGPSLPPPRPFLTPPPEKKSNAALWALVAVGMVLFVMAALFVVSRLR